MVPRKANGSVDYFKTATPFLLGTVMAGSIAFFAPHQLDRADVEKLTTLTNEVGELREEIKTVQQTIDRRGVRADQMAEDIARIAEKDGVTAHPQTSVK